MLSAVLDYGERRDPGLDRMSVANVTLMDLDRDLSVLLDDSLAMLT